MLDVLTFMNMNGIKFFYTESDIELIESKLRNLRQEEENEDTTMFCE